MKHILLKVTILCSAFLYASLSFAVDEAGIEANITPSSSSNLTGLQVVGGYSSQYWNSDGKNTPKGTPAGFFMITQSPSFSDMMLLTYFYNQYQINITNPASNISKSFLSTKTAINSLIIATDSTTNKAVRDLTLSLTPKSSGLSTSSGAAFDVAGDLQNLDVDNFIKPFIYSAKEKTSAKSFIDYITNQYAPTPNINFAPLIATKDTSSNTPLQQALNDINVQKYIYLIRRKAALSSIAISNLNYFYNERIPQPTSVLLSKLSSAVNVDQIKEQLPANLKTEASPLALQQWMATRRLNTVTDNSGGKSETWTQSIEQASPATLQRETVYLLAEIQKELFKQRMLQERLLATTSVQQLQATGNMEFQIQQLQRTICNGQPFNTLTGVCPSTQAPPAATLAGS